MSRKLFIVVSMVIMAMLAVVVAKVFQEPYPVTDASHSAPAISATEGEGTPPAASETMSGGPSVSLPLTNMSPSAEEAPHKVAGLVSDRPSGSATVTEPPAPEVTAPPTPQPASGQATVSPPAPQTPQAPVMAPPPAVQAPVPTQSAENTARPTEKPQEPASATTVPSGNSAATTHPPASQASQAAAPAQSSTQSSAPSAAPAAQNQAAKPGTLTTKSTLSAKAGKSVVTTATLSLDGNVITLRLEASAPIKGKTFLLTEPDRGVLDLSGSWAVEAPRVPSNRMLNAIRVGAPGQTTRIVFDMKVKPARININQVSDRVLEVTIR